MQYYPYNSRSPLYRSKFGAVASGEKLMLRLLLHTDAAVHTAFLLIKKDGGEAVTEIELSPKEMLESYRFYDCETAFDTGLYWYSFRYTSDYGEYNVIKSEDSLGIVRAEKGDWWQLTVYDADFATPEWLDGGLIYQIFPDRFFASGKKKENVPDDRFLCSDWRKQPEYLQNTEKCRLGNDYYGGDFCGIAQKLPYLKELGVTCIYLNPIFESHSNHRYNTADYMNTDSLLGSNEDFKLLCKKAKRYGISVLLDGVFSHTGDDSIYFNRHGRYGADGAYNNPNSKYSAWYKFRRFPDDYSAWWGVPSLPETNETDPSFCDFITGENGVLRKWLRMGACGWRLDVADELPDAFLERVRSAVKSEDENAFVLGEVWEDASNKTSYGARRKFLLGKQLDSVMNYPFCSAIISFVRKGCAEMLCDTVQSILENYPPCSVRCLMNHIGTHDTARLITRLAKGDEYPADRQWQAHQSLDAAEYEAGISLVKLAAVIQYTLPGVPSLFYGDEAGVQGYGDPFCRATYPWGGENTDLLDFYKTLGKLRQKSNAFKGTDFTPVLAKGDLLAFCRQNDGDRLFVAVNRGDSCGEIPLPEEFCAKPEAFCAESKAFCAKLKAVFGCAPENGTVKLPPKSFSLILL